jgi:hypothetical protein
VQLFNLFSQPAEISVFQQASNQGSSPRLKSQSGLGTPNQVHNDEWSKRGVQREKGYSRKELSTQGQRAMSTLLAGCTAMLHHQLEH